VLALALRAEKARRASVVYSLLLIGLFGAIVGVRAFSRQFVFPTHRVVTLVPPSDFVAWTLRARDGVAVHALELPAPPDARVFVYFHNNRETMVHGVALGRELRRRGFGVVLPEYRGYGVAKGAEPSEEGLYADADAVLDNLNARGIGAERIVLCGMSLGTGVAAEMARRGRGKALVLIAPYTSLPDVVMDAVPVVPARLLMPDRFDTLRKSADIRVPTLVVHGDADEIIPFWMGRAVARSIARARFVNVPGGRHGDLFARDGEHLLREIAAFANS
jgi:pimeloyl-ACP methyl ester carboxylesterase